MKRQSKSFDLPSLHKNGTYTLVALSLAMLWTGGAFGPVIGLSAVVVMAISWFWEKPRIDPDRFARVWTVLTTGYIGLTLYMIFLTNIGVVQSGVYFVLYLTAAKLFQRTRLDDSLQLLALSFLIVAASTAYNDDLMFGLFFVVYVVVGVVTFAVYHLRKQVEETTQRGGRRVRELFGPSYLAILAGIALVCFAASAAFFFLFPRLGFGFFAQQERAGIQLSGFSESVDLGKHGAIKDDNTVVMRVEFPNGRPSADMRHWRGMVHDKYDGVGWSNTLDYDHRLTPLSGWRYELWNPLPPPEERVRQEIYLEPIGSSVIFGLDPPVMVELSEKDKAIPSYILDKGIKMVDGEVLRFHNTAKIGIQYTIESWTKRPSPDKLREWSRNSARKLPTRLRQAYTQLPETNPRIRELAESLTKDDDNDYDRAMSVMTYLKTDFAYTTNLPNPGAEPPLDAFLFTHKRGHCEYFATAMAIMLRSIGIPTRNVTGFLGGRWNEYDNFLAVRNADAHAWVEVAIGGTWIRFDPTPPGADVSDQGSFLDGAAKFYDSLRFRWLKYVIEYDLETQIDLLRQAASAVSGDSEATSNNESFRVTIMDIVYSLRRNWRPIMLVLLLSIFGWGGIRIRGNGTRLDWRDAALIALVYAASISAVLVLWKPSAGWVARAGAVILPSIGVFMGLIWRRRPSRDRRKNPEGIARLYTRLCADLAHAGIARHPSEGPQALIKRVRTSPLPHRDDIERFIRRYMDVRFGGLSLEPDELRTLDKQLKTIRRALRR